MFAPGLAGKKAKDVKERSIGLLLLMCNAQNTPCGAGKVVGNYMKSTRKILEKYQKSTGKVLAKPWGSTLKVTKNDWKSTNKELGIYQESTGRIP